VSSPSLSSLQPSQVRRAACEETRAECLNSNQYLVRPLGEPRVVEVAGRTLNRRLLEWLSKDLLGLHDGTMILGVLPILSLLRVLSCRVVVFPNALALPSKKSRRSRTDGRRASRHSREHRLTDEHRDASREQRSTDEHRDAVASSDQPASVIERAMSEPYPKKLIELQAADIEIWASIESNERIFFDRDTHHGRDS